MLADRATRHIDTDYLKRAAKVTDEQVGPYLDSIVTSMHIALDGWRFGKVPSAEFELALDACLALFTEAKLRGIA